MIEHDGCTGCKYFDNNEVTYNSPCYDCEGAHSQSKLKDNYTPMTNADKIRAMNDKELAREATCYCCEYKEDCKTEGDYKEFDETNNCCWNTYLLILNELQSETKEN